MDVDVDLPPPCPLLSVDSSLSSESFSTPRSNSKGHVSVLNHKARSSPVVLNPVAQRRGAGSNPRSAKGPFFVFFATPAPRPHQSVALVATQAHTRATPAPRWPRARLSATASAVTRVDLVFPIWIFCEFRNQVPGLAIKSLESSEVSENCRKAPSFQIQITLSNKIQI